MRPLTNFTQAQTDQTTLAPCASWPVPVSSCACPGLISKLARIASRYVRECPLCARGSAKVVVTIVALDGEQGVTGKIRAFKFAHPALEAP